MKELVLDGVNVQIALRSGAREHQDHGEHKQYDCESQRRKRLEQRLYVFNHFSPEIRILVGWVYSPTIVLGSIGGMVGEYAHPA